MGARGNGTVMHTMGDFFGSCGGGTEVGAGVGLGVGVGVGFNVGTLNAAEQKLS